MTVIPIRTLHDAEARFALTCQPGDLVPILPTSPHHSDKDFHIVVEKDLTITGGTGLGDPHDWWAVIKCSCGLTFSGALNLSPREHRPPVTRR